LIHVVILNDKISNQIISPIKNNQVEPINLINEPFDCTIKEEPEAPKNIVIHKQEILEKKLKTKFQVTKKSQFEKKYLNLSN
jgi:hypothetical protein